MLTDAQCRGAKRQRKAYKLTDSDGLFMYVTQTGHRSWRYRYRIAGKQKQVVLGSYPEMSLRTARDLRDENKRILRSGNDPAVEAKRQTQPSEESSAPTFEAVAREWHGKQIARWKAVHAKDVITSLERDVFPAIGSLALDSIDPPLLLSVLDLVQNRGAIETGHRLRQRISSVFEYSIAKGWVMIDPAASIAKAMEPRIRGKKWPAVTSITDAREVLRATDSAEASPTVVLACRFLALTAQRPGMIRWLRWDELHNLDLKNGNDCPDAVWIVPAEKIKQELELRKDEDFDHPVPLCPSAVEVLRTSYTMNSQSEFVFPGAQSILKPISENALSYLLAREGFKGVHVPHGWRSSFSTLMNEWSFESGKRDDRLIIDLMLAHRPKGISASELKYNRARFLARRRFLAEKWSSMLMKGAPAASEVIQGRRRPKW
ncbi:MAG TPA: DUF4102 domain-containing protein [Myxococcales bacterium]|nr:DUF4102 domain-containing protein [Myxococcales bacterium]